jgi:hypothetical protein
VSFVNDFLNDAVYLGLIIETTALVDSYQKNESTCRKSNNRSTKTLVGFLCNGGAITVLSAQLSADKIHLSYEM